MAHIMDPQTVFLPLHMSAGIGFTYICIVARSIGVKWFDSIGVRVLLISFCTYHLLHPVPLMNSFFSYSGGFVVVQIIFESPVGKVSLPAQPSREYSISNLDHYSQIYQWSASSISSFSCLYSQAMLQQHLPG
jgi:hypothetical protein